MAVLLTTGEATTGESIERVRGQSSCVGDLIVVSNIRPFHKALNEGAARVTAPYFIQVDADMILDHHCVATLRQAMDTPNVGVAVGHLRDELLGQVVGIKMFRKECFAIAPFRNSISPDTDFVDEIARAGWQTIFVGARRGLRGATWTTLGEHRPTYTPAYTYPKYLLEGQRYRHRGSVGGLRWHLGQLEQSAHPVALVAQVALARGFFRDLNFDHLGRVGFDDEFPMIETFLRAVGAVPESLAGGISPANGSSRDRFSAWFKRGQAAFKASDAVAFRNDMETLKCSRDKPIVWIDKLALCQGLLASTLDDSAIEQSYQRLSEFLAVAGQIGSESPAPVSRGNGAHGPVALQDIMAYVSRAGLERFAVAPHGACVYQRSDQGGFRKTAAQVSPRVDARGRPRLSLPFQAFGHFICTEPARLDGLFWCLDLLRAGYLNIHVPTRFGAQKLTIFRFLSRHVLERLGLRPTPFLDRRLAASFAWMAKSRNPTYSPQGRRVLMVTENLYRGGSERQMVALITGLLRRGYDVRLLSLTQLEPSQPSYEKELLQLGITPECASPDGVGYGPLTLQSLLRGFRPAEGASMPPWLLNRIAAVASAIDKYSPAVVHCSLDVPGVAGALAGCTLGVPKIIIQLGSMAIVRRQTSAVEILLAAYKALVCNPAVSILNNSDAGARDNENWMGLRKNTIAVLRNGFIPESSRVPSADETAAFRNALGLPADAPVVGTLMRFVAEKDPDLWLDTAAEIAKSQPDVRFVIGGFGPLEESIRNRLDALGLRERVVMLGPVTDTGLAYSIIDVVLLSSAIEGLPNVMLEAQALGRPVVAPDVGGTSEALIEGCTGIIARPRSAQSLAGAVVEILNAKELREHAREEGPKFVAERFGLDEMLNGTLRHYGF